MSDEQPANGENRIDLVGAKVDMVAAKLDQLISGPVQRFLEGQSRLEGKVDSLEKGQAAHREEAARGFEVVRKELADGLAPLSGAVRYHTAVLKEIQREGISRSET